MIKEKMTIKGMACPACAQTIENNLSKQYGIIDVEIEFKNKSLSILFDENRTNLNKIDEIIVKSRFIRQRETSERVLIFQIKEKLTDSSNQIFNRDLLAQKGLYNISINLKNGVGYVRYNRNFIEKDEILNIIKKIGHEILDFTVEDYINREEKLQELKMKEVFKKLIISMIETKIK